ncbi:hypothetical protein [Thomasclavelia sp.]|uniref:hypothetical protein n=1 Tax=Thomasclavelia sp. TaxID=3025757 RepID=UPI0025D9C18D|nr:hypothetical protein [Thomasclavelia sp.]
MFDQIDIHNCTTTEAKVMLDNHLNSLSPLTNETTVIHGYSSKVLQLYVRKQYHHQKIKRKILTMNPGETILILK